MPARDDEVLRALHRASVLAGRPGVSVVSADAPRADRLTGSRARTSATVDRLSRAGRVRRVRRDVLALADETGRFGARLDDLVAAVAEPDYLITGGRALQALELTDQHHFGLVAVCASHHAALEYRGETARFIRVGAGRVWGQRRRARGTARYARAERALLDAVDHPRYGVSLSEAARALRDAALRDAAFTVKLAHSAERYGSHACARRLGVLLEQAAGEAAAEPLRRLIGASRTPVPLRAGGDRPADGPVDPRWRVILNADVRAALEAA